MTQSCNRWLLAGGVLAVLILVGLTSWLARYSSNPLEVLPKALPEIEARRIYQENFLQVSDLLLVLRGSELLPKAEALVQKLETRFPDLHGHIRYQYPWEEDLSSTGELVGYAWTNSSAEELEALANRLTSPDLRAQQIDATMDRLATAFTVDAELRWMVMDPLRLAEGPGLSPDSFLVREGIGYGTEGLRVIQIDLPGDRNDVKLVKSWIAELTRELAGSDLQMTWEFSGWGPYLIEITRSMRTELRISALFTFAIVLLLFVTVYRTIIPFFILGICLALTALGTILLGDLLYGSLNAISIGFAAILIALVVDYSVIVYQEQAQPDKAGRGFEDTVRKPVIWAAATTAIVFLGLNLSAIPGIAQLGTLVALGLILGATISLVYFRRLITPYTSRVPRDLGCLALAPKRSLQLGLALVVLTLAAFFARGLPRLDTSPDTMLPKYSASVKEYEALREALSDLPSEPMALLFRGATSEEALEAMDTWRGELKAQFPEIILADPSAVWPRTRPLSERKRAALIEISEQAVAIRASLETEFREDTLAYLDSALAYWKTACESPSAPQPQGVVGTWVLQNMVHISDQDGFVGKGLLSSPKSWEPPQIHELQILAESDPRTTLLGWNNLGPTMERLYQHDSRWVVVPAFLILLVVLFLIYRSFRLVALSVATIGLSAALFLSVMDFLGLAWNPVSLMAIPLFLGAGLDYTIHVQLAMQRSNGDLDLVSRTLGKALLVCGCSTAAGFGSLGWSNHPGLASLGVTSCLSILSTMFVAICLLPGWWVLVNPKPKVRNPKG